MGMLAAVEQPRSPWGLLSDTSAPRLYDRFVAVLRGQHSSRRTLEAYLCWIRRYIEFPGRQHPRQPAEGDVNRLQTPLAVKEHVSALVRHPLAGRRLRHPPGPGIVGPQRRAYQGDLHARFEPGKARRAQSGGRFDSPIRWVPGRNSPSRSQKTRQARI